MAKSRARPVLRLLRRMIFTYREFIREPVLKIIEASFGNNLYKLIGDFPIQKFRTLQGLLT